MIGPDNKTLDIYAYKSMSDALSGPDPTLTRIVDEAYTGGLLVFAQAIDGIQCQDKCEIPDLSVGEC